MIDQNRLEDLILARLSVRTKSPPSPSDVTKSLFTFVSRQLGMREWRAEVDAAIRRLRDQGFLTERRLQLTDAGTARLSEALGSEGPPRGKSWKHAKRSILARLTGQVGATSAASLVARELGIEAPSAKTSSQVADSWLMKTFELKGRKLTPTALKAALLARELGLPARPTLEEVVRLAAIKVSGAKNAQPDEIVRALTDRWLDGSAPAVSVEQDRPAGATAPTARVLGKVREVARGPDVRRFGPSKVFIGSVWEALRSDRELRSLGEDGFKQLLVDAHRRGELVLSRADLVQAMDPKDVLASETRHLNAVYHFIQIGEQS